MRSIVIQSKRAALLTSHKYWHTWIKCVITYYLNKTLRMQHEDNQLKIVIVKDTINPSIWEYLKYLNVKIFIRAHAAIQFRRIHLQINNKKRILIQLVQFKILEENQTWIHLKAGNKDR